MKNTISLLIIMLSLSLNAQTAPTTGKKVLEVKETFEGEYNQDVSTSGLSKAVISAMEKRLPKKLEKYGFTDITINEVGKVKTPKSLATKMSEAAGGNDAVGKAQLRQAETTEQIETAVDKIYADDADIDWKFQVNFTDNTTGYVYKVRLSMTYAPKYIVKKE